MRTTSWIQDLKIAALLFTFCTALSIGVGNVALAEDSDELLSKVGDDLK